jgi:hypothetical protein
MATKPKASIGLESFIDELIRRSKERGYNPSVLVRMRAEHGTLEAIERLVQSGEVQSGFRRLKQLALLDWSIESAVTKFPTEFSRNARECAEWRLNCGRLVRETAWRQVQLSGMRTEVGWSGSAREYSALDRDLCPGK